jgi:hypothetical protein
MVCLAGMSNTPGSIGKYEAHELEALEAQKVQGFRVRKVEV